MYQAIHITKKTSTPSVWPMVVVLMLLPALLCAQQLTVSAPSRVAAGENFRIAYKVNTQDVSNFNSGLRSTDVVEIVAGPYTSSQSSFQMVNGHTTSSSSITYTYTLYAVKNGTYNIPAATIKVGGKTVSSAPAKITVAGTARSNSNGAPRMHGDDSAEGQARQAGTHISGSDLFIKVSANKHRVFEQEPILLTYKVYTLVDLTQLEGKMPDLTGFHTQEIPLPQQKSFHVENVNGKNYRCVTWSQYVMYPQMTGKLEIPSITFKGIVVQQNRNVDPLEAFFNGGSGYIEVKREIKAPGVTIQVDPLPNRPAGFSGGVGRFTLSAQLENSTVKAGNPLKLRVVVGGVGNLKLIKQPVVTFPKDFDTYDAKVTDKTKLTTNGLEGNMIYDFLAVPRNQGSYTIPPIELTYYDTAAKAYKTVKSQPLQVTVEAGDGKTGDVVDYSQQKAKDIRPIKTGKASFENISNFFFGTTAYGLCILLPLVAFVVLLIVFRKRAIDNADLGKMRGKKANKVATKRLRKAKELMNGNRQGEFYDEVLRALWGYVGDKLNMPVEQLSRENISDKLSQRGVDETTVEKFISALDECEFERYAPGDATGNMNKTFTSAMTAIMEIENMMKKNRRSASRSSARSFMLALLFLLLAMPAGAVSKQEADEAYKKGQYQLAIKHYQQLLNEGGYSAEIYYNLGNAYFRTDNITQAMLSYERARLLAPGDQDIRFNLEFARSKTIDKITPQSEMFFVTWYHSLVNLFSVDTWACTAVGSICLVVVLLLVYLFASRMVLRKVGFYGAVCLLLLFGLSNLFAYQQRQLLTERRGAIVVAPTVVVKKTPSAGSTDEFVIHEGTRVDITDKTIAGWRAVRIADGREGWVLEKQIEEI
ncbi:MAG: BatD family protein [Prevotella sp.]|nr:BatD family protein [Prevotella sp.]